MKYEQYKEEITNAIKEKMKLLTHNEEGFVVIKGFSEIDLDDSMPSERFFNKDSVPIVMVVGKTTGLIYTFSLKMLLPHLF